MSYGDDLDDLRARRLPVQTRTRTRLPEEEDPSPRQPASPRRSLVTILGVIVLLLGAIVIANQTGGGGSEGSASDEPAGGGQAEATAPSGELPVEGEVAGIPSGFAQTEQGAESAAANYAVALEGEGMFDAEQRQAIVGAVYAPDVAAERSADLDAAYSDPDFLTRIGLEEDGEVPAGMDFVSRVVPVGTSVVEFGADSARVAVWYSALFGLAGVESTNPVTESWYTTTYDLVWADGDWKVTGSSQEDGPVPVARDQRASSAEEMSDAVERFGGFTYAR
ncbi:hypothetical protein [Streptomyces sp. 6N223]|uniref:hypothetical protein n=1 Tax=Streptomyces sp. 6N223 TaxID=3457412 RepID=UPI003FD66FDC